jgi:Tfp pilus assembly protein PilO
MQLTLEQKNKLTRIVLFVVFILAVLVFVPSLGPYQGIKAAWTAWGSNQKKLETAQKALKADQDKVAELPTIKMMLAEAEPEVRRFEQRLPQSPQMPELLRQLDELLLLTGQLSQSERRLPDEPKQLPGDTRDLYWSMPLELSMISDYHRLAYFINGLENSDRFSRVDYLRIDQPEESDDKSEPINYHNHQVNLTISTFRFIESASAEKTETPAKTTKSGKSK